MDVRGACRRLRLRTDTPRWGTTSATLRVDDLQRVSLFKGLLTALCLAHCPWKVVDIDALLEKFKGNEQSLYRAMCARFKTVPQLPAAQCVQVTDEPASPDERVMAPLTLGPSLCSKEAWMRACAIEGARMSAVFKAMRREAAPASADASRPLRVQPSTGTGR